MISVVADESLCRPSCSSNGYREGARHFKAELLVRCAHLQESAKDSKSRLKFVSCLLDVYLAREALSKTTVHGRVGKHIVRSHKSWVFLPPI